MLTAGAATMVWRLAGVGATPLDLRSIVWILLAIVAFFVVNSLLVSSIIAFASDMPVRVTWWRAHRHTWHASLGMHFVGVLIAVLWVTSPWTIALAAIPLTAIYYTLRNTVTLETQTIDALFNLADILDARDPYTHGHSLRVGQYAEKLALAMDLPGDDAHLIFLAGRLHDIGKCAIKNEVLLKAGPLTDDEREHMCIHPEVGSSMLASFSLFRECARYVRGHHERWDGKGYPDGLAGRDDSARRPHHRRRRRLRRHDHDAAVPQCDADLRSLPTPRGKRRHPVGRARRHRVPAPARYHAPRSARAAAPAQRALLANVAA